MIRWIRTATATAIWAYLFTGLVGVVDTAIQLGWGGLPEPAPPLGALGAMLAAVTLNGWFGAVLAVLAFVPLSALAIRRDDGLALGFSLAVAASLAGLVVVVLGGLIHDQPLALWWRAHLGTLWLPKLLIAAAVAYLLAAGLRRPLARLLDGPTWRLYLPLLVMIAATLAWPDWRAMSRQRQLHGIEVGAAPAGAPNLVLVVIDALRRDKLSCLDDRGPGDPAPGRPGRRGTTLQQRLVGEQLDPAGHGDGDDRPAAALAGRERHGGAAVHRHHPGRVAWQAGWSTAAVVANPYLIDDYGFNRGFADFDHTDVIEPSLPAAASTLAREATRYTLAHDRAHRRPAPGRVRSPAGCRCVTRTSRSSCGSTSWNRTCPTAGTPTWTGPGSNSRTTRSSTPIASMNLDAGLREQLPDVPADVRVAIEALYDGEVRHADRCVGALLDTLQAAGVADDTWVVVVADHGEEFFEHGGFEHGHSLLPEVAGCR